MPGRFHRYDLKQPAPTGAGIDRDIVPGRDPAMTRLCTNLPRTPFSTALVARLYRFRWQIELCFKEWKSSANLHKCDAANPHIVGAKHSTSDLPCHSLGIAFRNDGENTRATRACGQ